MLTLRTISIYILAAICKIGGGYLIWLFLKENKPWWYAALGGIALIVYGIAATFQQNNFARVYATYGGIFIIMSLFWANIMDDYSPDIYDISGTLIALFGVSIIYFAPR